MSDEESAEPIPAGASDKRHHRRFTFTPPLPVSIRGDARPARTVRLVNISVSGAAILADQFLGDPGLSLVLALPDHPTDRGGPVPCELRWVLAERDALPHRWLHGARFADLDRRARWLIEDLIHDACRLEEQQ
jgi:hypothetical protein